MKTYKGPDTVGIMVRIPKTVKTSLEKEAIDDQRTTANLIRKILKEYVTRKESE